MQNNYKYIYFTENISTTDFLVELFNISNWFTQPDKYDSPFINNNIYKYLRFKNNITTTEFQTDIFPLSNWFSKPTEYPSPFINNPTDSTNNSNEEKQADLAFSKKPSYNPDTKTLTFSVKNIGNKTTDSEYDKLYHYIVIHDSDKIYYFPFHELVINNDVIDENGFIYHKHLSPNEDIDISIKLKNHPINAKYSIILDEEDDVVEKDNYKYIDLKNPITELPNTNNIADFTVNVNTDSTNNSSEEKNNDIIDREIFNKIPGIPEKIIKPMTDIILNTNFIDQLDEVFFDTDLVLDDEERRERGIEEQTLKLSNKNIMFKIMYPFMILTNTKKYFENFVQDLFKDPDVNIGTKFYGGKFDENYTIDSNMDLEDLNFSIIGKALNSSATKQTIQRNHNVRVIPGGLEGSAKIHIPFNQIKSIVKNKEIQQIEQVASFLFIGGFLINDFYRALELVSIHYNKDIFKNTGGYLEITNANNGKYIKEYNKNSELINFFYSNNQIRLNSIINNNIEYDFYTLKKYTNNRWIKAEELHFGQNEEHRNVLNFMDDENDIVAYYEIDRKLSNNQLIRYNYTLDYAKATELTSNEIWKKYNYDSIFQEYWENIGTLYTMESIQVFKNTINQILLEDGIIKKFISTIFLGSSRIPVPLVDYTNTFFYLAYVTRMLPDITDYVIEKEKLRKNKSQLSQAEINELKIVGPNDWWRVVNDFIEDAIKPLTNRYGVVYDSKKKEIFIDLNTVQPMIKDNNLPIITKHALFLFTTSTFLHDLYIGVASQQEFLTLLNLDRWRVIWKENPKIVSQNGVDLVIPPPREGSFHDITSKYWNAYELLELE